jgi:hypothetical protein
MRRTIMTSLLLSALLLTGCGPSESQARSRAEARPGKPAHRVVEAAPEFNPAEASAAETPPRRPPTR